MKFWAAASFLDPCLSVEVARAGDEAGYEGVVVGDHLIYPAALTSRYPYSSDGKPPWDSSMPWPDAWVLIGAMAMVTSRLRFCTSIYVAPARHPLVVAKAVSTAAVLSGGRVALGAGIGWMREEFDAAGQDFSNRGKRLDEILEILGLLWSGEPVEYHGAFYEFPGLSISPVPTDRIPIFVGGDSDKALRRAARADGWLSSLCDVDAALERVSTIKKIWAAGGEAGPPGYEMLVALSGPPTDFDAYRRLRDAGVTGVVTNPWASLSVPERTTAGIRAAMDRFADRVVMPMADET